MNGYFSQKNLITMNEQCGLITEQWITDQYGNQIAAETVKSLWCGKIAVGADEFYKAGLEGLKPDLTLVIYAIEYNGEEAVIFNGKKYTVIRLYERTDGLLELHCAQKVGDHRDD